MCNEKERREQGARAVDFIGALLEGKTPECPRGGKCALAVDTVESFSGRDLQLLRLKIDVAIKQDLIRRFQRQAKPVEMEPAEVGP